jgi:hypothetical protein
VRRICSGLALYILSTALVLSAEAKVLVLSRIEPSPVRAGVPFTLQLQRIQDVSTQQTLFENNEPRLPDLPGLTLLSRQSAQEISSLNQSTRLKQTWEFTFQAAEAGQLRIPPIALGQDEGKAVFSEPIAVTILSAATPVSAQSWAFPVLGALGLLAVLVWQFRRGRVSVPRVTPGAVASAPPEAAPATPDLDGLRRELRLRLSALLPDCAPGLTTREILQQLVASGRLSAAMTAECEYLLQELEQYRFQGRELSLQEGARYQQRLHALSEHWPAED